MKEVSLPEGYRDAIYVDTEVHLSFLDRIRLLFGWRFCLYLVTYYERLPGKAYSEADVKIFRPRRRSKLGVVTEGEGK